MCKNYTKSHINNLQCINSSNCRFYTYLSFILLDQFYLISVWNQVHGNNSRWVQELLYQTGLLWHFTPLQMFQIASCIAFTNTSPHPKRNKTNKKKYNVHRKYRKIFTSTHFISICKFNNVTKQKNIVV